MLTVGVNGYGTIGKRVADAIRLQPDMRLAGVAKKSPDHGAVLAQHRDYPLYGTDEEATETLARAGFDPAGSLRDLLNACDLIVDAAPGGIGEQNVPRYREAGIPYILQGAESADAAAASFCGRTNFAACRGAPSLRVVSCNTTGLARTLGPLAEQYDVERGHVTLIRRGGDPDQSDRGPINDIIPDPITTPSHHGDDLQTVLDDPVIQTVAVKVPTTLMHVHSINLTVASETTAETIRSHLSRESRVALIPGQRRLNSIGTVKEMGRDAERPRGDIWENCVFADSISATGREISFIQAVHQESIVVPESVDAIRAIEGKTDQQTSYERTNQQLGIGDLPLHGTVRELATPSLD